VRVLTRAWPWLKAQGPGHAHCLLSVAPLCEWVLVEDVDEFYSQNLYFPKNPPRASTENGLPLGPFTTSWDLPSGKHEPKGEEQGEDVTRSTVSGPQAMSAALEGVSVGYGCKEQALPGFQSVTRVDSIASPAQESDTPVPYEARPCDLLTKGDRRLLSWTSSKSGASIGSSCVRRVAQSKDWLKMENLTRIPHAPPGWNSASHCEVEDPSLAEFGEAGHLRTRQCFWPP